MSARTTNSTEIPRQSRVGIRFRRAAASVVCAVGVAVALPMTASAYEVPKGIYSTHARCVAAGLPWVLVHAYSTFRCQGFYSAGKGGYKLYLQN